MVKKTGWEGDSKTRQHLIVAIPRRNRETRYKKRGHPQSTDREQKGKIRKCRGFPYLPLSGKAKED